MENSPIGKLRKMMEVPIQEVTSFFVGNDAKDEYPRLK
jgi:hypothetical protein